MSSVVTTRSQSQFEFCKEKRFKSAYTDGSAFTKSFWEGFWALIFYEYGRAKPDTTTQTEKLLKRKIFEYLPCHKDV